MTCPLFNVGVHMVDQGALTVFNGLPAPHKADHRHRDWGKTMD